MYKIFSSQISTALAIGLLTLFLPQNIFAAQLSYKVIPNNVAGDTREVVEVRIDPEGKNVNVVEGTVSFGGVNTDSLLVDVSTDGSVFTIWPTEPSYNREGKSIQFVGGTPEGLTKEGLLFTMRLSSTVTGNVDISWSGVKTFLNDGNGTEESTSVKSLSVNLSASKEAVENNTSSVFPGFNFTKSVTIILLIIILLGTFIYGYKKIIKN
ncbi:MAG: hypothetical protein WAV09_02160 [Minisyncoccia bacterium]